MDSGIAKPHRFTLKIPNEVTFRPSRPAGDTQLVYCEFLAFSITLNLPALEGVPKAYRIECRG